MLQVVYCYLLGTLAVVNSQHVQEPVLAVVNLLVAGYFLVVGSIAGWQQARRD